MVLQVSDTGSGIAAEDLPRVFDRFYRGDTARSEQGGESGLGLAIARAYVQAHGGEISAASQVGQGSTFTIRLPLQPPAAN
jgi:two-component system sensor histidine kinase BaeS